MKKFFETVKKIFKEPDTSKVKDLKALSTKDWEEIRLFALDNRGK